MTINIMKINLLISINHSLAVEKLNNELDERSSKLSGSMLTAELIKINFFTPYGHTYLMIEIRFKTKEC
jgi:hypothetical protein